MFLTTRKTFRKYTSGFTLIELLIVIAIMGILAAAVLIAINPVKRQNTARDANVQSDIASIGSAAQAYYSQLGYYPAAAADIVTNGDLKALPSDPSGDPYVYAATPSSPACTTAAGDCTGVSVSRVMYWPTDGTQTWCFQTSTGKGQQVLTSAGCPALP